MIKFFKILLAVIIILSILAIILALLLMFRVKVKIDSNPQEMELSLNNKKYSTPIEIKLWPGKYEIKTTADNKLQKEFEIDKNQSLYFYLDFNPDPIELSEGKLIITSAEETDKSISVAQNDFSIEGPDIAGYYQITLNAVFNAGVNGPPIEEQKQKHEQELKIFKEEALNWLKERNFDPQSLKIKWNPSEAENY